MNAILRKASVAVLVAATALSVAASSTMAKSELAESDIPTVNAALSGAPDQAFAAIPDYGNGEWRITSGFNGYAMDDSGPSLANGAAVIQWPVHGGANQRWRLESTGDGYWRVRNVYSNKCMDVSGASLSDGARLIQWDCGSGANQRFRLPDSGRGQIIAKHSGKAVDVPGSSRVAGTQLIQWSSHTGINQQWVLERVGGSAPPTPTPTPAPVRPNVAAAQVILKAMPKMHSPWDQIFDAPIKNSAGSRHSVYFDAVIEQFNPTIAEYKDRYQRTSVLWDTKCNIFAADVMRAMGVPLPTKGNLGTGASGSKYTDRMTANASDLHRFLTGDQMMSSDPATRGWREISATTADGLRQLIAHVNAGKPAVASSAGHIAVVRPGQGNVSSWRDLLTAQAGLSNFLSGKLSSGFGSIQPRFFVRD